MIPDVAKRADELKGLCLRYRVSRLELFGSAATGQYHRLADERFGLRGRVPGGGIWQKAMRTPTSGFWRSWSSFLEGLWTWLSARL